MSVAKEEVQVPWAVGSAVVTRIYRGENGKWSAEFDLNFRIKVGDGREVFVRKYVNVTTNEQRGRKKRTEKSSDYFCPNCANAGCTDCTPALRT